MKKLLSPALSRWFCYTLVLLCSAMYAQPCTFEDVVKETTHNVYYEKNYSYAVSYKLGYFDKNGVLYYKIFETDEVETLYIKESKEYLLFDGNI